MAEGVVLVARDVAVGVGLGDEVAGLVVRVRRGLADRVDNGSEVTERVY